MAGGSAAEPEYNAARKVSRFFERNDRDADGMLSKAEVKRLLGTGAIRWKGDLAPPSATEGRGSSAQVRAYSLDGAPVGEQTTHASSRWVGSRTEAKRGPSIPDEFVVILHKTPGAALGLDVDDSAGNGLLILAVCEGCVQTWNAQYPSRKVDAGDVILRINGAAGTYEALAKESRTATRICMHVQKASALQRGGGAIGARCAAGNGDVEVKINRTARSMSPPRREDRLGFGSKGGNEFGDHRLEYSSTSCNMFMNTAEGTTMADPLGSHVFGDALGALSKAQDDLKRLEQVFGRDKSADPRQDMRIAGGWAEGSSSTTCPRPEGEARSVEPLFPAAQREFLSASPAHGACDRCRAPYSGHGTSCGLCRKQSKTLGHPRQCPRCGVFFWGYSSLCVDCLGPVA